MFNSPGRGSTLCGIYQVQGLGLIVRIVTGMIMEFEKDKGRKTKRMQGKLGK
jgi:hypothetical protein